MALFRARVALDEVIAGLPPILGKNIRYIHPPFLESNIQRRGIKVIFLIDRCAESKKQFHNIDMPLANSVV